MSRRLSVGQLRECHGPIVLDARQRPHPLIAAVPRDNPGERAPRTSLPGAKGCHSGALLQGPDQRRASVSLVIDSSMTLAWYFEDEKTAASIAVLNRVAEEGAVVPALWCLEVLNGLRSRYGAAASDFRIGRLPDDDLRFRGENLVISLFDWNTVGFNLRAGKEPGIVKPLVIEMTDKILREHCRCGPGGGMRCAVPPAACRTQKSHGQMSSRPVVSKSGKFRVARCPPLRRAMAAIIPSGALMGRPCRSAALMMSP